MLYFFTGNKHSTSCLVLSENIQYTNADILRKASRKKRSIIAGSDEQLPRTSN